jgi:hypothetical protein
MFSTWKSSAAGRRRVFTGLALVLAALAVSVAPAFAQAAAAPPARTISGDAGVIYYVVKADKTADFEMIVGKLKEALGKSENAVHKQQAAGWRVFRQTEPGPNGNALYVALVDPAVKDADYNILPVLYAAFPAEAQALYATYRDSLAGGVSNVNYKLVSSLGK